MNRRQPKVAVEPTDVIIMAVPSHGFRLALTELAPYLRPWAPVVSLAPSQPVDEPPADS